MDYMNNAVNGLPILPAENLKPAIVFLVVFLIFQNTCA